MYYAIDDDMTQLEHHGILGQKWGVRRFQKADGSLTAQGKARYDEDSSSGSQNGGSTGRKSISIDKDKVKKAALITAGVAAGVLILGNPATRAALSKYGKTAITELGSAAGKGAATFMNKAPGVMANVGKNVASRASKVGDAMIDAALVSAGGIAISKINEKYADSEDDSESTRNTKKIIRDTTKAGIETATKSSGSSSSNNSSKGGNVGKDVTDKLGAPSKKSIDKQSADWQNLFKDSNGNQLDAETRGTIKALASQGYDMDQIKKYKQEFGHGDIQDWIDSIIYDPARW